MLKSRNSIPCHVAEYDLASLSLSLLSRGSRVVQFMFAYEFFYIKKSERKKGQVAIELDRGSKELKLNLERKKEEERR